MANPTDLRVKSYNNARAFRAAVGATAILPGQLCKFSSNVLVPAADNDKQIQLFVALEYGISTLHDGKTLVVPFADAVVEMAYSGTPTLGTAYGISGPATVDATDTTNDCVTVIGIDTDKGTVDVIEFQIGG